MIFLNIGEPDFTAPPAVLEAARRCLAAGRTQYTDATGLPALREAISRWYARRFGLDVPARRIVVTAGASAALQLVTLALFPILATVYVRLAHREEREVAAEMPEAWRTYAAATPRWFPRFGTRRSLGRPATGGSL